MQIQTFEWNIGYEIVKWGVHSPQLIRRRMIVNLSLLGYDSDMRIYSLWDRRLDTDFIPEPADHIDFFAAHIFGVEQFHKDDAKWYPGIQVFGGWGPIEGFSSELLDQFPLKIQSRSNHDPVNVRMESLLRMNGKRLIKEFSSQATKMGDGAYLINIK